MLSKSRVCIVTFFSFIKKKNCLCLDLSFLIFLYAVFGYFRCPICMHARAHARILTTSPDACAHMTYIPAVTSQLFYVSRSEQCNL